jgi:hypothetical protein
MVDLNARLVEPAQGGGETGLTERAVPFRFAVTWTFVSEAFEPPKAAIAAVVAVAPINDRMRGVITAPVDALPEPQTGSFKVRTSGDEPVLQGQKNPPSNASVQWEMVVPKMVRAVPRATRAGEISAPSSHSRSVFHQRPESPRNSSSENLRAQPPAIAPNTAAEQPIPNFCSLSPSFLSRARQKSLGIKLLLAATALAGLAVPVWKHFTSTPTAAEVRTTPRSGGWTRQPVTRVDPGFNRTRELIVYRPSLKATDCRFEFNWRVDGPGVGWVFRAKDTANYYAMRIKVLRPGPSPTISVEHFTVYRGTEGAHAEKVLVVSMSGPVLRIRTDLVGPSFALYIGGNAAEYWTDTRLTSGGLGFFEEWRQGADVEAVRMSFAPGTEIQREGLRLYTTAPSGGD